MRGHCQSHVDAQENGFLGFGHVMSGKGLMAPDF